MARVTEVRRGFAEAEKLRSLSPPASAVTPPCPHFGPCGGCSLQGISYEAQLREKQNQVWGDGLHPSTSGLWKEKVRMGSPVHGEIGAWETRCMGHTIGQKPIHSSRSC